jgi:hypothetical protein
MADEQEAGATIRQAIDRAGKRIKPTRKQYDFLDGGSEVKIVSTGRGDSTGDELKPHIIL